MGLRLGVSLGVGFLCIMSMDVWADDAQVLPKGRFRIRYAGTYSEASNQHNSQGNIEGLGSSYSRPITGDLLKAISSNPQLKGILAAIPALKNELISSLNADVKATFWTNLFCMEYGVTDRLSMGFLLPLVHADVEVNATSTPNSSLSAKYGAQLAGALQDATTIKSINALLRNQYKYLHGLESWSGTGMGDLELGGKFNYYRDTNLLLTLKSGLRIPTGRKDDPNNLVDVGFGDGQYDLGTYNYVDYRPLHFLSFTLETGYVYQFQDSDGYRIPTSPELPLGNEPVELSRKLGDYWEAGLETNVTAMKLVTFSGKYRFKQKFKDSFSDGPAGTDLSIMEKDTDEILHQLQSQIEYSNLSRVRAGRERIPYAIALMYHTPLGGENVSDTQTVGIQLKTYF